jgi:glycosyltransferase involved in cell wall biosynthesis
MRVALVHDWLNGMRGGEQVLQAIAAIFPRSKIYTLFCDPEMISSDIKSHEIKTSFIQNLPRRKQHYRYFLPLFPRAIETFNFNDTDLVISSSHCVAKGAVTGDGTLHICYCHSPMRYVWDRFDDYFPKDSLNPIKYRIITAVAERLRRWDKRSNGRVDLFVANSSFVQWRIENYYNRPARVIHPPVDTKYFTPGRGRNDGFYLVAGALVPYKRIDLVIEAFRGLREELVVIGDGPDFVRLVNAAPANVKFTGWVDRETLREYYRSCKALIFPGVEDFGIVPVEAQSCGRPVIAFAGGGIKDTVTAPLVDEIDRFDGFKSGLFFKNQTVEDITNALKAFSKLSFDAEEISKQAARFSKENFFTRMNELLTDAVGLFRRQGKIKLEERLIN